MAGLASIWQESFIQFSKKHYIQYSSSNIYFTLGIEGIVLNSQSLEICVLENVAFHVKAISLTTLKLPYLWDI